MLATSISSDSSDDVMAPEQAAVSRRLPFDSQLQLKRPADQCVGRGIGSELKHFYRFLV
jgi:hypothetical protein